MRRRQGRIFQLCREIKAINRVQKEKRADALIKILTTSSKGVQRCALVQELARGEIVAGAFQRLIANGRLSGSDDAEQIRHEFQKGTSSSSSRRFFRRRFGLFFSL